MQEGRWYHLRYLDP